MKNTDDNYQQIEQIPTIKAKILTKMSASGETDKASKDDKENNSVEGTIQTPTPNQGEEGKETNKGNKQRKQKGKP